MRTYGYVLHDVFGFSDLIDLWIIKIKRPIILCARSSSSEQSTKPRSHSESMREVCLLYSRNNKIVWLSNMADTFTRFTRCTKVCGLFLLNCAFRILIGWAGKLRSRGKYAVYKSTFEALKRPAPSLCLQKKVHTRLRRKRSRLFRICLFHEGLVVFYLLRCT